MATTSWLPYTSRPVLRADRDGTLGYSDGTKYYQLYGRLQLASDVPPVTLKISRPLERSTGLEQVGIEHKAGACYKQEETITLDNILFKYEETSFSYEMEVAYVREEWNSRHQVRRLFPVALRGRGVMLSSIKDRVYVLANSIPPPFQRIERGYLRIDGSDLVETFLETIGWASRCEGIRQKPAETGEMVDTFVIKDRTRSPTVGYYFVCTKSRLTNGLICHLEPIGGTKYAMKKWVPHVGDSELGPWGRRVHHAQEFLFD